MLSVKKKMRFLIKNRKQIRIVIFIAYSFFIIYYTVLSRTAGVEHRADLRFMWAYREMLTGNPKWKVFVLQNICNILFFVPFGLLFPKICIRIPAFKNRHWLTVLTSGMLFSIFIEVTQYITCCGLCEIDDVLCNGLGSLIGYWLYLALLRVWAIMHCSID